MRTACLFALLLVSWLVVADVPAAAAKVAEPHVIRHRLSALLGRQKQLPEHVKFGVSVPLFRHRDRPEILIPETVARNS